MNRRNSRLLTLTRKGRIWVAIARPPQIGLRAELDSLLSKIEEVKEERDIGQAARVKRIDDNVEKAQQELEGQAALHNSIFGTFATIISIGYATPPIEAGVSFMILPLNRFCTALQ